MCPKRTNANQTKFRVTVILLIQSVILLIQSAILVIQSLFLLLQFIILIIHWQSVILLIWSVILVIQDWPDGVRFDLLHFPVWSERGIKIIPLLDIDTHSTASNLPQVWVSTVKLTPQAVAVTSSGRRVVILKPLYSEAAGHL